MFNHLPKLKTFCSRLKIIFDRVSITSLVHDIIIQVIIMKIAKIIKVLEDFTPLHLQESYDNSGLLTGSIDWEVHGVLCTLDVTEEVVDEAASYGANLIVAHHPVIFNAMRSITGKTYNERTLIKAIKKDVAIYAAHTNLDNVYTGINKIICEKLGLLNCRILNKGEGMLVKLVTFVPADHAEKVRNALFASGAGHIGNYDSCSYSIEGTGSFRGGENTNPFVGKKGKLHFEDEVRIETIIPKAKLDQCIIDMLKAHPYEEVAYDVYPLENEFDKVGAGMSGEFKQPVSHKNFMELLKATFKCPVIRYAGKIKKEYRRISVCSGTGGFLLQKAIHNKSDAFITSDIKYHQFFEAEQKLLFCDVGHYESEQFAKEIFYNLLIKNFSTFAVHLSRVVTNPVNYYI